RVTRVSRTGIGTSCLGLRRFVAEPVISCNQGATVPVPSPPGRLRGYTYGSPPGWSEAGQVVRSGPATSRPLPPRSGGRRGGPVAARALREGADLLRQPEHADAVPGPQDGLGRGVEEQGCALRSRQRQDGDPEPLPDPRLPERLIGDLPRADRDVAHLGKPV